jgi:hypothetical protein
VAEYPLMLLTFVLQPPGILAEREHPQVDVARPYLIYRNEDKEKLVGKWQWPYVLEPNAFFRMLAKIGHAGWAAYLGPDKFAELTLFLPDLILGHVNTQSHYLGTVDAAPRESELLHRLHCFNLEMGKRHFAVADICLFAMMEAPT